MARSEPGAGKRVARRPGLEAPQRDPGNNQLMDNLQSGREVRGVELREHVLSLLEATDQQEAPDLKVARVRGVDPVAMRLECCASRFERLHRPAQVARGKRDLGFGDQASRASYSLSRTEGASGTSQESLGPNQVSQLCHRNAAKRQCGRVVTQRNPL